MAGLLGWPQGTFASKVSDQIYAIIYLANLNMTLLYCDLSFLFDNFFH